MNSIHEIGRIFNVTRNNEINMHNLKIKFTFLLEVFISKISQKMRKIKINSLIKLKQERLT